MLTVMGRAIVLALLLWFGSIGVAYAHALPGSILTFSKEEGRLALSVSFSLDDLIIAAPSFKTLESEPQDQKLSTDDLAQLATYFEKHLQLQQESKQLPLKLNAASLQIAQNDHVGTYVSVVSQLSFPLPSGNSIFPLTLTYDAVMHEVRTHRATVYWTQTDGQLKGIADFGFRTVAGKPRSQLLQFVAP